MHHTTLHQPANHQSKPMSFRSGALPPAMVVALCMCTVRWPTMGTSCPLHHSSYSNIRGTKAHGFCSHNRPENGNRIGAAQRHGTRTNPARHENPNSCTGQGHKWPFCKLASGVLRSRPHRMHGASKNTAQGAARIRPTEVCSLRSGHHQLSAACCNRPNHVRNRAMHGVCILHPDNLNM